MRKLTAMLLAALVLPALAAHAQVAVPRIVPAAPFVGDPREGPPTVSFLTANPAAMQWGAPSRIGGGTVQAEIQLTKPITGPVVDISGTYGGLRLVGETFSFAVQAINLSTDSPPLLEWDVAEGGFGIMIGESWAVGLGVRRATRTDPTLTLELDSTELGVSWMFDENVFFGLSVGRDTVTSTPGVGESSRNVLKYGVGYRDGGAAQWHFEAFGITRDDVPPAAAGPPFPGVQTFGLVGEVKLGPILLSVMAFDISKDPNKDISSIILDVGLAPDTGIAVLFHRETTTTETKAGPEFETTVNAITVVWLF